MRETLKWSKVMPEYFCGGSLMFQNVPKLRPTILVCPITADKRVMLLSNDPERRHYSVYQEGRKWWQDEPEREAVVRGTEEELGTSYAEAISDVFLIQENPYRRQRPVCKDGYTYEGQEFRCWAARFERIPNDAMVQFTERRVVDYYHAMEMMTCFQNDEERKKRQFKAEMVGNCLNLLRVKFNAL